jgi:hypothetical protein
LQKALSSLQNASRVMFRFTIRDILWLTALVALAVSWWHDRKTWHEEKAALMKQRDADVENERRIANLRAMEWAGRIISPRDPKPRPAASR